MDISHDWFCMRGFINCRKHIPCKTMIMNADVKHVKRILLYLASLAKGALSRCCLGLFYVCLSIRPYPDALHQLFILTPFWLYSIEILLKIWMFDFDLQFERRSPQILITRACHYDKTPQNSFRITKFGRCRPQILITRDCPHDKTPQNSFRITKIWTMLASSMNNSWLSPW